MRGRQQEREAGREATSEESVRERMKHTEGGRGSESERGNEKERERGDEQGRE